MECPYCKADIDTADLAEINNPNQINCPGCGEVFYADVLYVQYKAIEINDGVYECSCSEIKAGWETKKSYL